MKYCKHCGKELFDEAVICPGCGCPTDSMPSSYNTQQTTPASPVAAESEQSANVYYSVYFNYSWAFIIGGIVFMLFGLFAWVYTTEVEFIYEGIAKLFVTGRLGRSGYSTISAVAHFTPMVSCLLAELLILIPKTRYESAFKKNNPQLYLNKAAYKEVDKQKYAEMKSMIPAAKFFIPLAATAPALMILFAVVPCWELEF